MFTRLLSLAALLVAAMLLAAACGGDDSDSKSGNAGKEDGDGKAAAAEFDACELLTKEDVAEVIGEGVTKTEPTPSSEGSASCGWYGSDEKLLVKGVTLIAAKDNGKERWEGHKELVSSDAESVSGLGDEAFTDGEVIAAYEGDNFIVISPLYNDAGVSVDDVKPLGEKALAELG